MLNAKTRRFIVALATIIVVAALALPIPVAAQEAEDSSPGNVQGVTALLLMTGLGAVAGVSLYYIIENQAARRRDAEPREK